MKKITLSILAFAASIMVATAQAPAKFNYQGIARNTVGAPLASKALGMRITVHDGSPTGAVVYQESQNPTTNAYGLYNVTIGDGTTVTGNLSTLAWGTGNKYIQVEIDVNGGTAYTDLGATQLLSVPYAMYAASGTAPTLTLSGTTLSAGGNTVTLPAGTTYTAGTGIGISGTNVISTNLAAGTGITISGNTVAATNTSGIWNASQLQGSSVSATTPSTGQSLVWNGSAWAPATTAYTAGTGISITSGVISVNNLAGDVTGAPNATTVARIQGTSVATTAPTSGQVLKYNGSAYAPAADADAQTLSISGTSLSISGGNSVTLPTNSYTAGTGLTLTGTTFSANNTSAIWNANQIQSTGVSATAPTSGQALVYNGTNWTPTTLAAGSLYTGGTGITVSSGGVISANNLAGDVTGAPNANTVARIQGTTVSATAPTNGQVLKYNGTNWTPGTDVDNDAQTLSLSGSNLSISGGNSVTLPAGTTYTAGIGIGISGSTISTNLSGGTGISISGNTISANNLAGDVTGSPNANTVTKLQGVALSSTTPTNGQFLKYNGTNWLAGADNDAQTLSLSGSSLSISGGNSVTLPTGTTYTAGTGIGISGTTISASNTSAIWNANQLQSVSVSGTAPTNGQVLTYNGTSWSPATPASGSGYTGGTGISISGGIISANNLAGDVTGAPNANTVTKIQGVAVSSTAPTSGQTLVYNGTNWAPGASSGTISGTTNYVTKFATGSTVGNSLLYDDGTNVAIGYTGPFFGGKFSVTTATSANDVAIAGFTNGLSPTFYANQTGNGFGFYSLFTGSNVAGGGAAYFDGGTGYGVVVPNGRVGIGTATPGARLDLTNSLDSFALRIASTYTGATPLGLVRITNNTTNSTISSYGTVSICAPNVSVMTGTGMYGVGGNIGVRGLGLSSATATSPQSFGMYGEGGNNADAIGVYGLGNAYSSATSGTKYGVYGVAANGATLWAGYFAGNVSVTGAISKGSGTFKIDHPLDPGNKYLYHSFVESPDMMNIYNGNITTDAAGYATVTMPSYFDALNKDYRYQLTVIGTFAQAIIKEKMNGNHFVIQTNQPNIEVSWMVTGVRQDAYANAHRVQPEVDKEAANKGKYLHPTELGQPATSEINYELNHPKMAIENHDPETMQPINYTDKK